MNHIKILGIDASLSNFGFAISQYDLDGDKLYPQWLTLVRTEIGGGKKVRKNSDDLDRAQVLHNGLREAAKGCALAVVEMPVGSQSARAMASYGICVGVLASCPIPLIQVTPYEVKLAAVGHMQAAKEEMIEWAIGRWPNLNWIMGKVKGQVQPLNANEHLADALAAIVAGVQTDQFAQATAMMRSMRAAA